MPELPSIYFLNVFSMQEVAGVGVLGGGGVHRIHWIHRIHWGPEVETSRLLLFYKVSNIHISKKMSNDISEYNE